MHSPLRAAKEPSHPMQSTRSYSPSCDCSAFPGPSQCVRALSHIAMGSLLDRDGIRMCRCPWGINSEFNGAREAPHQLAPDDTPCSLHEASSRKTELASSLCSHV